MTRRGGRFLSAARDGQFNGEETPHAALTGVGNEGTKKAPIPPSATRSVPISLPESPVADRPACEYTTHKMHARTTDGEGIAHKQQRSAWFRAGASARNGKTAIRYTRMAGVPGVPRGTPPVSYPARVEAFSRGRFATHKGGPPYARRNGAVGVVA